MMMMPPVATQETTFYPLITPVWTNLPVKIMQADNQAYTCTSSPGEYRYDSVSPQSDRLMIADDCLSPTSASGSVSPSRMPFKKRHSSLSCSSTEDSAKYNSSMQEDDKENEDYFDKPIVTSRGKVKKYRCKRCPYVAITKRNFWNHSRIHIKPEKILACPKCPFVTEYKHHLESHLLNHLNSKPFKCDKCEYSSVSKNMLDSHLKSHSSLRKYRCNECNFASKYFHQLKVHLNKSEHKDGFMLNDDGSVNVDNVISPRGTKRVKTTRRRSKKVTKEAKKLQELVTLVDSYPSTMLPLKCNSVDALPITPSTPIYGYDQMYNDYQMQFANPTNFGGDQVVPEVSEEQTQFYEQNSPVDYSKKSASFTSASSCEDIEEEIDVGGPDDLSDMTSMPLDLSKSEASKPFNDDSNVGFAEEENVHQQIQHLRMNLESMHQLIWTLEQNMHTSV